MNTRSFVTALSLGLATLAFVGCEGEAEVETTGAGDATRQPATPGVASETERMETEAEVAGERTGAAMENAAERTGAALESGAQRTGQAIEETGQEIQQEANEARLQSGATTRPAAP